METNELVKIIVGANDFESLKLTLKSLVIHYEVPQPKVEIKTEVIEPKVKKVIEK